MKKIISLLIGAISLCHCGKKDDDDSDSGKNYEFSTAASVSVLNSELALANAKHSLRNTTAVEDTCDGQPNYICTAPTALTGKYYSVGLLIQAGGSGMQSYLLQDNWNGIEGSDDTYDFDASTPIVSEGDLICCGGKGDLTGDNVYFSDVSYVFGYLDATFKIPYTTAQESTVPAGMLASHTVRFVLADDIEDGYVRGDLLYKDGETFKWMDGDGNLSATRPDSPVTMSEDVVDFENPNSDLSDLEIPVFASEINDADDGKNVTSEEELQTKGRTYSFDFDTTKFVVIMMGQDQLSLLQTVEDLLGELHLQGLKNDELDYGYSGTSNLTIE